ncbi:MAG: DedA family protein [Bacteroidetes bacterium]|nr:DedA family protein [Bacteroidota bacterium]
MPETVNTELSNSYSGIFGWLRRLRDWVELLAAKPYAVPALFVLAVSESIFFPIPVDVLLIALCVSLPRRSLYFATIATIGSVLGGIIGYALGYWLWYRSGAGGAVEYSAVANLFFERVPGFSHEVFDRVQALYEDHGFVAVFLAGFTPLPYKVVTISAGVFKINFGVFIVASIASRALRFFLVATLFFYFGRPIKDFVDKYLEILSVLFVILLIGGFVVIKYII